MSNVLDRVKEINEQMNCLNFEFESKAKSVELKFDELAPLLAKRTCFLNIQERLQS